LKSFGPEQICRKPLLIKRMAKLYFVVFVCFVGNSFARFELIDKTLSSDQQVRSLSYLDTVTQQVFIKHYTNPPQGGFRSAPVRVEVLTEEFSSESSRKGRGQLERVESFALNSLSGQTQMKASLMSDYPAKEAQAKFDEVIKTLRKGSSRYKLLQVAESGKRQVGVYHNTDTGEFILQAVENKGSRKHSFALTSGAVNDLFSDKTDQTTLNFKNVEAQTLHQFDQASSQMSRDLLALGFRLPQDAFKASRDALKQIQEGFERLHLGIKETSGSEEVFEESLYHPERNQLLRRIFRYKEDGTQDIIEEELIDLNSDIGFTRAEELYKEDSGRKEIFSRLLNQGVECPDALGTVMPVSMDEVEPLSTQVDVVMEKLWEDQLQAGLPNEITIAVNNSFVFNLSLFGQEHALVGEMNRGAQLIDLNFGDLQKARQHKIRIRHVLGDNGDKQFLVEAFNEFSGEWEAQATLEGETYLDDQGLRRGRLSAHIKGKQTTGSLAFDDFEKSVYNLKFQTGGVLFEADPRIRLNGNRPNPFQGMVFRKEGDGGLMNIAFQLFFSKKGKREKVRQAILEEATKTFNSPTYEGLLTSRDIARVAESVTAATDQRTSGFNGSKNEVEAIATAESFSQFNNVVLSKFLADFLKDESAESIQEMTNQIMVDFRQCLDLATRAQSASKASQCMDVFTNEAPVALGEKVLIKKLGGAGLGELSSFATQKFRACVQESYDGKDENTLKAEGLDRVKGCIYSSIILSFNVGASTVVDQKVGAMSQEMGLPFSYSSEQVEASMGPVRSCLQKEGLAHFGPRGAQFDTQKLRNLPTDLFEQSLMFCTNTLVRDVTKEVGTVALAASLSQLQNLDSEAKARIARASLAPGLETCMDRQQQKILNSREIYKTRRSLLVGQGPDENPIVDVTVPTFDSEECSRVLTSLATGHAAKESIDALLGAKEAAEFQQKDNFSPLTCFEKLHKETLDQVDDWIVENTDKSPAQLEKLKKARDEEIEGKSAQCLAVAISWASYYAAQNVIEQKLGENPDYAGLSLNSSLKARIGERVKQCFERELSKIKKVDEILNEQEKLKDICAADMLKDPMIQKDLFSPYIMQALSSVDVNEQLKERLVVSLGDSLGERLQGTHTIDEAMGVIDGFKDEAIPLVVEETIKDQVYEVLSLDISRKDGQADSLTREVVSQIFGADGKGSLGNELKLALTSGEEGQLSVVVEKIENEAAMIIGPQVIRETAEELLRSGDFESAEEVEELVKIGSQILNDCLNKAKPTTQTLGESLLDFCIAKTNLEATRFVLDKKLSDELSTNVLLSTIVNEEKAGEFKRALINDKLSQDIEAVAEMDEGPEKEAAGARLILNFKIDATSLIFNDVLNDVVADKLPAPKGLNDAQLKEFETQRIELASEAKETFNRCIGPVKSAIESRKESISELDLDECMNKSRFEISQELLPRRLITIVEQVFPDASLAKIIGEKASQLFKSCSEKLVLRSNSTEYGYKIDGCLNQAVLDFVGLTIDELKKERHGLFGTDSKLEWSRCQQQIERAGQQYIFGSEVPRSIRDQKGDQLFASLYKAGDELEPKREPGTDWIEAAIIKCASARIAPTALIEFREEFLKRNQDQLDAPTEALIFDLSSAVIKAWRTPTKDGSAVRVDLSSLFIKDEKARKDEASPATTPFLTLLAENEEVAIGYLSLIAAYDPEVMKKEVEDFETKSVALSSAASGEVPIESYVDVMAEGQMMETLIESMIAKTVRDETMKALTDEGADTSAVWLLSSKEMIGRLFSTGQGLEVVKKIKNEYLVPLMNGQLQDSTIPEDLMNEAKEILIADTGTDGFVETLFAPIAQKGLSDQRAGIETAWFGKRWLAYWIGYDTDKDFIWGDKHDSTPSRYHLRRTPTGQKAVNFFAKSILRPTLMGELSSGDRDKATEQISDLLKEAMSENL